jgi:hypothetical protein
MVSGNGDGGMREAVEFEFGSGSTAVGSAAVGLVMADGSVRVGPRARRRVPGPRPVRPTVAPVAVRPAPVERPVSRFPAHRSGPRVLERHAVLARPAVALRFRVRRMVAGLLAVLVTAAVVVGLGLLADSASAARAPESPAVHPGVTVGAGEVLLVPVG